MFYKGKDGKQVKARFECDGALLQLPDVPLLDGLGAQACSDAEAAAALCQAAKQRSYRLTLPPANGAKTTQVSLGPAGAPTGGFV